MDNEYKIEPLTAHYLSEGHQYRTLRTVVISPKVPAGLSILGSAFIIQDVLRNPNKRTKSIYHRLMIGLSINDILFSFFFWFLTSWPMPKGYFIFASGNLASCDAAGFFTTIGMFGAPLYNCSLATYYLWKLRYNWNDRKMKTVEKWLHLVPWLVGIGSAVAGLALDAYGPLLSYCWVRENAYPVGCDLEGSSIECIRSYNGTDLYFRFGFCILYFLSLIYVATLMSMVYRKVRQVERNLEKFSFTRYTLQKNKKDKSMRKKSRRVMIQGILYSVALLIIVFLPIVVTVARVSGNEDPMIEVAMGVVNPLQGFFNMLIYLMPVFRRIRKQRKKKKKDNNNKNDNENGVNKIVMSDEEGKKSTSESRCLCYSWCLWPCFLRGDITKGEVSPEYISNKNFQIIKPPEQKRAEIGDDIIDNNEQGLCVFHPRNHVEEVEEEKQEITRDPTEIPRNRKMSTIEAVNEEDEIDWKGLGIYDGDDDESDDENDYFSLSL